MARLFTSPDAPCQLLVQLRADSQGQYELDVSVTDGNGHIFDSIASHTGGDLAGEDVIGGAIDLIAHYWYAGRLSDVRRMARKLSHHANRVVTSG